MRRLPIRQPFAGLTVNSASPAASWMLFCCSRHTLRPATRRGGAAPGPTTTARRAPAPPAGAAQRSVPRVPAARARVPGRNGRGAARGRPPRRCGRSSSAGRARPRRAARRATRKPRLAGDGHLRRRTTGFGRRARCPSRCRRRRRAPVPAPGCSAAPVHVRYRAVPAAPEARVPGRGSTPRPAARPDGPADGARPPTVVAAGATPPDGPPRATVPGEGERGAARRPGQPHRERHLARNPCRGPPHPRPRGEHTVLLREASASRGR